MNVESIKNVFKSAGKTLSKHSPAILTGIGIAGMITSTVFAVKATPKVLYLLEEKKKELEKEDLTVRETVETAWKCYIPSVALTMVSTACLVGASAVSSKRNAMLATACSMTEATFREYQQKVIETIGKEKENDIHKEIATDKASRNPAKSEIIITGKGKSLVYESISGRYFESDIESIRKIENNLNKQLLANDTVSVNDLFYEFGLDSTDYGDTMGWNSGKGLIEIGFGSLVAEDGRPAIVLCYSTKPYVGFDIY